MALFEDVREVIVEQLSRSTEEVKPESRIREDLGADSLDAVELVMALEEKFGVEIPDSDAEKFVTVDDVVKYVQSKQ